MRFPPQALLLLSFFPCFPQMHPSQAYLAPEHEGEGPVAADDLTLAHDRRETL